MKYCHPARLPPVRQQSIKRKIRESRLLVMRRIAQRDSFPGLPEYLWDTGFVYCLSVCDWRSPLPGENWVHVAESIAAALQARIVRGYAISGFPSGEREEKGRRAQGAWNRIRDRVPTILGGHQDCNIL